MGLLKRMLEEQEAFGYQLVEVYRSVCPRCIADPALKLFVSRNGQIEACDFCGAGGPHGISLGSLFDYMGGCLRDEWDDPLNGVGWDGREGGWQGARVIDSDDLLWELDEPLGDPSLREAFVDAFQHEWCQRDPYRLSPHERLVYGWERFADYVKHEARYLFLKTGRVVERYDDELIEPAEMLVELEKALAGTSLIRRLPAITPIHRGRATSAEEEPRDHLALGSPPCERTRTTRMSPAGISMFYGAEDVATALEELRPGGARLSATVAQWVTARELRYLDLAELPDVPSIFDMSARKERPWLFFLYRFAGEIAKPVEPDAGDIDYVPTQVFTEYVRHVLGGSDDPVLGIRYLSAIRSGGVCWVLFVDAGGCTEATSGWEADPDKWLGLEPSSLRRYQATPSWTQVG